MSKSLVLVLIAVAFMTGSILTVVGGQNQDRIRKETTEKILNTCTEGWKVREDLINNCRQAYKEAQACVSNPSVCDLNETNYRLNRLMGEKNQLENRLIEINTETAKIRKFVEANPFITK